MGRSRTKGLVITAVGLLLLGVIGFAVTYGARLIVIGAAYKAKMLCSEVFVAGRDPDAVLADLVVDDLAMLRVIGTSIDSIEKTATTSLYGFAERKARYRGDVGCALAFDEVAPVSREVSAREGQPGTKYPPIIELQTAAHVQQMFERNVASRVARCAPSLNEKRGV